MKTTPVLVLLNLFLISSVCDASQPIVSTNSKVISAVVKPVPLAAGNNDLKCDACEFIAKGLDDKVFHNDHLVELATEELDSICNILPASVHDMCISAVNGTVPDLLAKIGDFVANEGCEELGICKNKFFK